MGAVVANDGKKTEGRTADGSQSEREVGLCFTCRYARRLTSAKGSGFYRCEKAAEDDSLVAYPPLPVTRCRAYSKSAANTQTTAPD